MLRTITLILFYLGWHISKHLLFPLSRVKLKALFTSFMTISFFDVFEIETLIDFSIKYVAQKYSISFDHIHPVLPSSHLSSVYTHFVIQHSHKYHTTTQLHYLL